jgi:glucose/arabinose dehydrogenase
MMHGRRALTLGLSGFAGLSGAARGDVPVYAVRMQTGLARPVFVAGPPGDNNHLFMLEQGNNGSARVRILDLATNTFNASPFITITGLATGGNGSEQGLLGLAFDPNYATNGNIYLNYTATGGSFTQGITKIVRYTTSNFTTAPSSSAQLIMQFDQPQANHNGGWMGFGKDGYLYIGTGDGGNGYDTGTGHTSGIGNAQDLTKPLGKMLRIDPSADEFPNDANKFYTIPKGGPGNPPANPFFSASNPTVRTEVWLYGLRNPWRDSFDRKTGDLYIGDVGQGAREEVDFVAAGGTGGTNFGWKFREGKIATPTVTDTPPAGFSPTDPIFDYNHTAVSSGGDGGIAVTGGYVYRGPENKALEGTYFFGDYQTAKIWVTKYPGSGSASAKIIQNTQLGTNSVRLFTPDGSTIDTISSFGEDNLGRLYITELGNAGTNTSGELFRLIPAIPGDANGDRVVNDTDFKTFLTNYAPGVTGKAWAQGDFNDDQTVDFRDSQILELNYGRSVPLSAIPGEALAGVPEPAGLAGIFLALPLFLRRRGPLLG